MLLEALASSVKTLYINQSLLFIPTKCTQYVKYVMGCGGRPNHRHDYLKWVFTTTNLDNTMTYFYYIIYSMTLPHDT